MTRAAMGTSPLHVAILRGGSTDKQIAERFSLTIRYVASTRRTLAEATDGRRVRSDAARAMIASGATALNISRTLGISLSYVHQLTRTMMTQSEAGEKARELPGQCERHAQACRDAGGFWALSETCLGLDHLNRRRMTTCLPLTRPVFS